ncbi:hypothetical protein AB0L85_15505 [Streptomyces sp. NPDC052051]|uniref:hypothetical protein n=1 Tax=Streptomyces sp. NPDC052051 TaxID=3154649 RepID=UPI00343735EE
MARLFLGERQALVELAPPVQPDVDPEAQFPLGQADAHVVQQAPDRVEVGLVHVQRGQHQGVDRDADGPADQRLEHRRDQVARRRYGGSEPTRTVSSAMTVMAPAVATERYTVCALTMSRAVATAT